MRYSNAFIPTLREEPQDAENISHKLLVRGGFIKQLSSGIFIFLPVGWKVISKIYRIIKEEMDRIGAQELFMPSLTPSQIWKESGRWEEYGDDMLRVKDRKNREYALSPTHEEIITEIARKHIHSYKDLPQIWYQVQTKFRDELRPRGGLLRVREFLMKDSYSLDESWEGLDRSYELHKQAYIRIFKRCGLKFVHLRASSGLMGGSLSEEFAIISDAGEDEVAICENCGYSANLEVAISKVPNYAISKYDEFKKVYTPDKTTVEELAEFLKIGKEHIIKSLVYYVNNKPYLVLIRGDYEVNEEKLRKIIGNFQYATDEDILSLGSYPGFIGPHNLNIEIISDESIKHMDDGIIGANEKDYHYIGYKINFDRYYDIRKVKEKDLCPECGKEISIKRAIEIGHIFKLGTRYSISMGAYFQDKDGSLKPIIMGSYGIGLGRIMSGAIEIYNDENGIIWPISIAPFEAVIIDILGNNFASEIYEKLRNEVDILLDDRKDISAGVKFNDADLIGIPFKIIVGKKFNEGKIEVQRRDKTAVYEVNINQAVDTIKKIILDERRKFEI
ncbi:MAG: proline--tRNA ligase [candidate division WOR-3 bacterium]|nr:proline--tRNA ligase [candidate division WOR-3 bacterium]MDW8150144.1 proline--tRNA ligase [candidate division WOR-3 bacterium]